MFSTEEKEMIVLGLQMRRNLIQTGTTSFTVGDVQAMGETVARAHGAKIRALSSSQMELILKTDKLIQRIYDTP